MLDHLGCEFEVKFSADESKVGTFSGFASVFNNKDFGGDVVAPGAFADTLAEWGRKGKLPPLLLQHGGWGSSVDDMLPIGKLTSAVEKSKGLAVEGELFALNTERGQYVYEGMKAGALDGMSIGYSVKEVVNGTKPTEPRRLLKKIDLIEISVVTFPMNDKARISTVKSFDEFRSLADIEGYLRDAGGFSRKQAAGLISRIKALSPPRDAEDELDAMVAQARSLVDRIRRNGNTA